MSKFVRIATELRETGIVLHALDDLKIPYSEEKAYRHIYSGRQEIVPILVHLRGAEFGLRRTDEGVLEVLGDDMQMKRIRKTLAQIQQRYAYHLVLRETANAGFDLVDERVGEDQVIRMTVRRWQ